MTAADVIQIVLYVGLLIVLTPPLGSFMHKVFSGERTFLTPIFGWAERLTYKIAGVDEREEMTWKTYAMAFLLFHVIGIVAVFLLQMFQASLPLNPQGLANVSWHSAFNTAVSFNTNTNWQGYAGETTMSYLSQMLGLAVQNFLSAAAGIAVFLVIARGLTRKSSKTLGNFWADLTRTTLYILLPISVILTLIFVAQGTVQTFSAYVDVTTLEGAKQTLPLGPAASQVAIKMLGTNGGGFFNANSAHPFESPTPLTNFLHMFALLIISSALTYTYGLMAKAQRQGWVIFGVMLTMLLAVLVGSLASEYMTTSPVLGQAALMEGKECRFGVMNSILFSDVTTAASCGAVNSMHSSLTPISGGLAMFNIMLGEVIFGGVGAGMYGMLLFVLLTVFLAGLMVGRSPEYLGKKIEAKEMKMVLLAIIMPCASILVFAGVSAVAPDGLSSLANKGPHGLSEILYAFTSAAGNNGSAFAGLNANTVWYNILLGITMLLGRFAIIFPVFAVAGSLAGKKSAAPTAGTFPTDSLIFAILLIGVIIIVGALTFLPALSLGPIVEHFLMLNGKLF